MLKIECNSIVNFELTDSDKNNFPNLPKQFSIEFQYFISLGGPSFRIEIGSAHTSFNQEPQENFEKLMDNISMRCTIMEQLIKDFAKENREMLTSFAGEGEMIAGAVLSDDPINAIPIASAKMKKLMDFNDNRVLH